MSYGDIEWGPFEDYYCDPLFKCRHEFSPYNRGCLFCTERTKKPSIKCNQTQEEITGRRKTKMADYEGIADRLSRQVDRLVEALSIHEGVICPREAGLENAEDCERPCEECWRKAIEGVE